MTSVRKYNNNIVLADDNGREVIVLGKGVGFLGPGSEIPPNLIQRVFTPQDDPHINEYIPLAGEITDYGRASLGLEFTPGIVVALADHLSVIFMRQDKKEELQSPLQWEIRHIYPAEYKVGLAALEIILRERNVVLPESEAISIALHFINAGLGTGDMPTTFKIVSITGEVIHIVEDSFKKNFDVSSFEYMRFANHVRNMIVEYITPPGRERQDKDDDELYELLVNRNKDVRDCCTRVCYYLRNKHAIELKKNDVSFMAMHITKIKE